MGFSTLTDYNRLAPNNKYTRGRHLRLTHIVLHHMANPNGLGVVNNIFASRSGKVVSPNYAVLNDGTLVGVVDELNTPYTNGNFEWNAKSITFEIANESTRGWTVSKAAHETTARAVADIAKRHGIPLTADRIIGHKTIYERYRKGYPTACPGGLDVAWIINRARQINGSSTPSKPTPATPNRPQGDKVKVTLNLRILRRGSNGGAVKQWQALLNAHRNAGLVVDGIFGAASDRETRRFQEGHGLKVDGIVGSDTWSRALAQ